MNAFPSFNYINKNILYVYVHNHAASALLWVRLRVNSLRLIGSALKFGGWEVWEGEAHSWHNPVAFNAPQSQNNHRRTGRLIFISQNIRWTCAEYTANITADRAGWGVTWKQRKNHEKLFVRDPFLGHFRCLAGSRLIRIGAQKEDLDESVLKSDASLMHWSLGPSLEAPVSSCCLETYLTFKQ